MRVVTPRALEWTLRVGAFMCFVGHGAFGIMTKAAWVPYFGVVGIGSVTAYRLMPLIGAFDITVGILTLVGPRPILTWWMLVWTIWTAALRPLSGEPVWEMLERAGNYGVPAAMLVLMTLSGGWGLVATRSRMRELSPAVLTLAKRVLTAALVLLLFGHGALGVMGKAGLTVNYASVMPASIAASLTPLLGWFEIALAAAVALWQGAPLILFVAAWKLATESLFATAGAPVWELVERGGSYAVPLALVIVVALMASTQSPRTAAF